MLEFKQYETGPDYKEVADIEVPGDVLGGGVAVAQLCIIASTSRGISIGYYEGPDGYNQGNIYAWWEELPNVKTAYEIADAIEVAALSGTLYYENGTTFGVLKHYRQYLGGIPCGAYSVFDESDITD